MFTVIEGYIHKIWKHFKPGKGIADYPAYTGYISFRAFNTPGQSFDISTGISTITWSFLYLFDNEINSS